MFQLVYRCRFCRQDELRDGEILEGLDRQAFEHVVTDSLEQSITHDCCESGSHRGLCDLVGVVVTANAED